MENNKKRYLIIPVHDTVILPDVDYQMTIPELSDMEQSRIKIDMSRCLIVPLKESKNRADLTGDDFYPLGIELEIMQIGEAPMGVAIQGHSRSKVRVTDITISPDGLIEGDAEPVEEIMDVTADAEKKLLDFLKETSIEVAGHIRGGNFVVRFIKELSSLNTFASRLCPFFDMTPEEKYELLKVDSFKERGLLVKEALLRFKGAVELQIDLNNMDDPEQNAYKKRAITKQIGMLQKELDSMDPDAVSEEDEFARRIEDVHMPEEVKKEVERTFRRFRQEGANSPEYSSLADYLDFVTSLKWETEDRGPIDLKRAKKVLERDHYGLKKVKERILEQIAVMALNKEKKGSILLLVGAPGTGKTSMGRSVAEALGRKYVRISLGGIRDEAEIRGHRRTYIGAMPGRIMEGIKRSESMDPVVVLDEVDKLAMSFNGDPSAALLEVLDPEQNTTFTDHYMNVPYDLSKCFFICTANNYDAIPQPLMDRMEVIELSGYTPVEKFHIAREHLIRQAMEDAGLQKEDLRITDGAIRKLISEYTMEAGVRGLKKQIDSLCRKAATKVVELRAEDAEAAGDNKGEADGAKPAGIVVKEKDVADYLGRPRINHDKVLSKGIPGVVTGLAWTMAGGEILFIESTAMPGSGQMQLTGQLGDVMKESAVTAMSLVKSWFASDTDEAEESADRPQSGEAAGVKKPAGGPGDGAAEKFDFRRRDIHIHIPAGAVPKDGPSAGITMVTALASLVTGRIVDPHIAMTGEISLRGQVLPIGGLPEKLMAAERAGIKKVLIPKDNEKDLEDVPKETLDKLTVVPVATAAEVMKEVLGLTLPV